MSSNPKRTKRDLMELGQHAEDKLVAIDGLVSVLSVDAAFEGSEPSERLNGYHRGAIHVAIAYLSGAALRDLHGLLDAFEIPPAGSLSATSESEVPA